MFKLVYILAFVFLINSFYDIIVTLKVCPRVCPKGNKMAVDRKQFTEIVDTGIKANKKYTKFYINFKLDGKVTQRTFDYSTKDWDKKTRISKIKMDVQSLKDRIRNSISDIKDTDTLNTVADIYFKGLANTTWTDKCKASYNLYCRNDIGKRKVRDIKVVHIDTLRKGMETKGHSKQTINGCKPRTIIQVLMKILKPILEYARVNKAIDEVPVIKAPKVQHKKKLVNNATSKLAKLYKTIVTLYEGEPFYRALFLLALYGRRWNEIRTLQWTNVDFLKNTYTIKAENNKIGASQTYDLPAPIAEALSLILDTKVGLIFKSPITGKELYPPKRQLKKVRDSAQIPELTMHYFRHILVSSMGESGMATTVLSASLGHTNLTTVNDFYLSANHTQSSKVANLAIENITSKTNNE